MKKIYYILFLLFLMPLSIFGQNSATATFTASVTIIKPIEISTTSNMNFAEIDAQNGGAVILHTDNSRSVTGGLKLKNSTLASAATFEVKGQNGYTYDILVPEGNFIMTNGAQQIILKDFKTSTHSGNFESDSQIIRMGATIEVASEQQPGKYITPAPLAITVSYN